MTVDEQLAAQARAAAERITARQRELDGARAEFQRSVRALYLGGGSLREIADVLGLSHQRVHQLLDLSVQRGTPRRRTRSAPLACSFCLRPQSAVRKLICGPQGVRICNDCVGLATGVDEHRAPASDSRTSLCPRSGDVACSFCGKRGDAGLGLVGLDEGAATVCTECLDLCREILAAEGIARLA